MKLKILSQVTILLLLSVSVVQAANILPVLGRNPFYKPSLTSVDDFTVMMRDRHSEVMEGLKQAGQPELIESFVEQFPQARIKTVEYEKGQTFQWMFYKRKGQGRVRVMKDVTWAGEKSFTGYEFFVDRDGRRYTFIVPLICGNLALKDITAVPAMQEATPAPVAKEATPVQETPDRETTGAVGPFRFVADAGYLHQFDPANYAFVRFGFEYECSEQLSFLAMMGGAPKVHGADGKSAALFDFLAQYSWSHVFAGVGLGAWITSGDDDLDTEDTDIDIIANIGARIYGEPDAFNTSLFLEARSGIDELSDFSKYGRVGVGLRFRF